MESKAFYNQPHKPEHLSSHTEEEYRDERIERDSTADDIEQKIEFREHQSYGSRLAEYITGLTPEDPELVDRLIEDQKVIRAKYKLPEREKLVEPVEYERLLRSIAKEYGIEIRATSDCGKFFTEFGAGGVFLSNNNQIGTDINKETTETHQQSLQVLEHELVHGMQHAHTPSMPIELEEYEAFVANTYFEHLKEDPDPRSLELFFNYIIGGSVSHDYEVKSKQQGNKIEPVWNNARYFLEQVDHIPANIVDALT